MPSFPTRILRSVLGPKFRDPRPAEHPEFEISADTFNAAFATAIGIGLTAPRASLLAVWSGSAFSISQQEEAWNIDHSQAHPTLARAGAGSYSYTFASSYLDVDGNSIPVGFNGARVTAIRNDGAGFSIANVPQACVWFDNPLVIQVRIWVGSTLADWPFWLEAL